MFDRSNSTKDEGCERLKVSMDLSVSANPQSTMVGKFTTYESDRHHVKPELSARSLH